MKKIQKISKKINKTKKKMINMLITLRNQEKICLIILLTFSNKKGIKRIRLNFFFI